MSDLHHLDRRDFLKWSAAAAAAGLALPRARLFGAQEPAAGGGPALVVIFLRGGADALHMLLPWKNEEFLAGRPTLRLGEAEGVLPLDGTFALHPALAPLKPAWDAKLLAPIVCAGSPHPTRSHFDAQDWMEYAAPGDRSVRQGWINRFLAASAPSGASEFRALGMQDLLPRSLRGAYKVLAVPTNLDRKRGDQTLDRFEDFYGDGSGMMEGGEDMQGRREDDDTGVVESGRMTIETLRRFQEIVGDAAGGPGAGQEGGARPDPRDRRRARDERETAAASPNDYPDSQFGRRLAILSKVIRADAGLEVAGLDYGGWDDHTNAGGADGKMAARMRELAQSLHAFVTELGPRMASTTVLLVSEFGRTAHENGNNGTDHGHGGVMWLIGGGVKGGQVHGKWEGLAPKALYQGRDLPVSTDFRDVYASVLAHSFGFEPGKDFFPGHKVAKLKLF